MSTEGGNGLVPPAELRLPPHAESVRVARRFLRELLLAHERPGWVDAAELALSEVVTNGVLHAHTELTVRISVRPDAVDVEVADGNPRLPVQRRAPSAEATTGRGLELVAALTQECGVRPEPDGKVVWFTVADTSGTEEEPSEDDLLAAWDDEEWEPDGDWTPPQEPDLRQVTLLQMPPTLWLAAREHHQALLRELVLYLAEHAESTAEVPDLALADQARHLVWTALLHEIDRARNDGRARRPAPHDYPSSLPDVPEAVDLELEVTPEMAQAFAALQDSLDAGERLAVADRLLVRPGLPEIVAVRDWACEQVVAQLAGVPASAWPGADQSRFEEIVNDREGVGAGSWDASVVTDSERGVVAADDANRVVAISRPLAQALGWAPEELVGRRVVSLIPPELREAHVAGFSRHLTTGQERVLGVDLELPVLRRDGTSISCSFLVERAEFGGRPVYLAWIEPIAQG